jgi:hypothetical protein
MYWHGSASFTSAAESTQSVMLGAGDQTAPSGIFAATSERSRQHSTKSLQHDHASGSASGMVGRPVSGDITTEMDRTRSMVITGSVDSAAGLLVADQSEVSQEPSQAFGLESVMSPSELEGPTIDASPEWTGSAQHSTHDVCEQATSEQAGPEISLVHGVSSVHGAADTTSGGSVAGICDRTDDCQPATVADAAADRGWDDDLKAAKDEMIRGMHLAREQRSWVQGSQSHSAAGEGNSSSNVLGHLASIGMVRFIVFVPTQRTAALKAMMRSGEELLLAVLVGSLCNSLAIDVLYLQNLVGRSSGMPCQSAVKYFHLMCRGAGPQQNWPTLRTAPSSAACPRSLPNGTHWHTMCARLWTALSRRPTLLQLGLALRLPCPRSSITALLHPRTCALCDLHVRYACQAVPSVAALVFRTGCWSH